MFVLKSRHVPARTQPFEAVAENIHPVTYSVILYIDEEIFTVVTGHIKNYNVVQCTT